MPGRNITAQDGGLEKVTLKSLIKTLKQSGQGGRGRVG